MLSGSTNQEDWDDDAHPVEADAPFDSGGMWNSTTSNIADFPGLDTGIPPEYLATDCEAYLDTSGHPAYAIGDRGMST